MRSNLLLVLILALIAWYLFNRQTVPPPVVEEKPTPVPRVDYSGVRTYYSPLNDPPVPATGQTYGGSAVVLGAGNSAGTEQRVNGAVGNNSAATPAPTVSSINVGGAGNR